MHRKRFFFALLMIAQGSTLGAPEPQSDAPGELRIAAASDLRFALDGMVEAFETVHPAVKVKVSYGSSGSFFAMIQNKAPFDLFLSADVDYPRQLAQAGLGADTNVFIYAFGRLALWVSAAPVDMEGPGMSTLLESSIRKIAIANPRHAPYGRAAVAALKASGIYERVRFKLVYAENVSQALQFVESGAADAGLVAFSLTQAPQLKARGRFREVPLDLYSPMEQGGLILNSAKDRAAARAFRDFMLSQSGRALLERHGFSFPKE